MYEVARGVLRARSLHEVVSVALSGLATLTPGHAHSVGIVDLRSGTWTVYDASSVGFGSSRTGVELPLSRVGADTQALRRGRCDVVTDVAAHPDLAAALGDSAPPSLFLAPVHRDGLLVGTLNIGIDHPETLEEGHRARAQEMAALVGEAMGSVQLREELVAAHDQARQANEAKTTFLTQMSHELRTPLNAIVGYIELLLEEPDDATAGDLRNDLDRIHNSSLHLLQLINDVLDLARVEAGRLEVTLTPVDLQHLMIELEGTVRPLVNGRGNVYRWQCDDHVVVMADPLRLRQVLLNLVGNAAKFTGQGVVAVGIERHVEGFARVTVSDTGVGIAPAHIDTLFDPFTQAHDRRQYGGTGLGLAISQRYAELMGARIEVASEVGVGSRFWMDLDLAPRL